MQIEYCSAVVVGDFDHLELMCFVVHRKVSYFRIIWLHLAKISKEALVKKILSAEIDFW